MPVSGSGVMLGAAIAPQGEAEHAPAGEERPAVGNVGVAGDAACRTQDVGAARHRVGARGVGLRRRRIGGEHGGGRCREQQPGRATREMSAEPHHRIPHSTLLRHRGL